MEQIQFSGNAYTWSSPGGSLGITPCPSMGHITFGFPPVGLDRGQL
jgi:hypothetical protein